MNKLTCKIKGHILIVKRKDIPKYRRYFVYCTRCEYYLSLARLEPKDESI